MNEEDFAYVVETKKSFDEAVVSVRKAVEDKRASPAFFAYHSLFIAFL